MRQLDRFRATLSNVRHVLLFAVAVLAAGVPHLARASHWEIDPQHTSAQFAVRHLVVSTVRGTLGTVTGSVNLRLRGVAAHRWFSARDGGQG